MNVEKTITTKNGPNKSEFSEITPKINGKNGITKIT